MDYIEHDGIRFEKYRAALVFKVWYPQVFVSGKYEYIGGSPGFSSPHAAIYWVITFWE